MIHGTDYRRDTGVSLLLICGDESQPSRKVVRVCRAVWKATSIILDQIEISQQFGHFQGAQRREYGCMKRTGYSVGGRALFIPMKVAMKPKKFDFPGMNYQDLLHH